MATWKDSTHVFSGETSDYLTIDATGKVTLSSGVGVDAILDENNLGSDSNTALATQQSIKAYVDANVSSSGGNVVLPASGTLANGDAVSLNSDGTVSKSLEVVGGTGAATVFESADSEDIVVAYVENDKVVIAYSDKGNSSYGTAIVGTVSGTSISFGTPVVFESASVEGISIEHIENDKVVITYVDNGNSNQATAIVGTVSGTSISFGTPAVFGPSSTTWTGNVYIGSDKVVIVRSDFSNGNGEALVGTVTGTSISFGSVATFESTDEALDIVVNYIGNDKALISYRTLSGVVFEVRGVVGTVSGTSISFGTTEVLAANSSSVISAVKIEDDKCVLAYADADNSSHGTAVVVSVSGTTISLGTPVVFESGGINFPSAAFIENNQILVSYRNNGNSNYGTTVKGTVSGTTISFDTSKVFESAAVSQQNTTSVGVSKVVVAYQDTGNGDFGTAIVIAEEFSNLEDWIGISKSSVTNANATIAVVGGKVNNQTGLVVGSDQYLQADGSISNVESDYLVGKALSSTELLIMGRSGGAAITSWAGETSAYTASAGDRLFADTSGGAFTITLPASPSTGDEVWFADPGSNWGTNNLTVDGNGANVDGAASFLADVDEGYFATIYDGSEWVIRFTGGSV